jgi:archaellum biogenesis protein FlaJ (TadC family)
MEDRQKIGVVLIVGGIIPFLLNFSIILYIFPLICIGLYLIIPPKEPKEAGLKNDTGRKRVIRGIGIGMVVVGVICLIGGIWFGNFSNWTGSLAAYGWLFPIVIGIILIVIGLIIILATISRK